MRRTWYEHGDLGGRSVFVRISTTRQICEEHTRYCVINYYNVVITVQHRQHREKTKLLINNNLFIIYKTNSWISLVVN